MFFDLLGRKVNKFAAKVDIKDDFAFEDQELNDKISISNLIELELDKTFSFDGTVDFEALKYGNKLFEIRFADVTDVDRNIAFGSLQTLLSEV